MKTSADTALSDIYGSKEAARFLIKNERAVGNVVYLDEDVEPEIKKPTQQLDLGEMTGGSYKPFRAQKTEVLYPSMCDIKDPEIREFIQVCHLEYVVSNAKPNAIFVVPDKEGLTAIKKDIKDNVKNNPDSAEGVRDIKTSQLIYKKFLIDVHDKEENNKGYEYRIPFEYPDAFNPDTVYRRSCRYKGVDYYIKLDKTGMKVSLSSDMSKSVSCKYCNTVGNSNYFALVFKGNLLKLWSDKMKGGAMKKYSAKALFKKLLKCGDSETAAFSMVGAFIKKYGVEKCKPYYSANLLQSAFAMMNEFGDDKECEECTEAECNDMHCNMLQVYKPITSRKLLNADSISKINTYAYNFSNRAVAGYDRKRATSKEFFASIKNAYQKVASDMRSANFINNQISADIAHGIYDATDNVDLAIKNMKLVSKALAGTRYMNDFEFNNVASYLDGNVFTGLVAQKYYPMLSIKESAKAMTGGADEECDKKDECKADDSLSFEWMTTGAGEECEDCEECEDGECDKKCPECGKVKCECNACEGEECDKSEDEE